MVEIKRIKIITEIDRPHITHDILTVFRKYDISITWMEVYTFVIYIKFPKIEKERWLTIKEELKEIYAIKEIDEINLIAFEERETEMKKVLDIVSQGVIVLDKEGKIKYTNKYAAENILLTSVDQAVYQKIDVYLSDKKIRRFLKKTDKSKNFENQEISLNNNSYLLNINPILNPEKIFLGYIITIQDMKKIGELLNNKLYHNPITFENIKGRSKKLIDVINHAKLFAPSDSPILIAGESGTGKELFARAIHNHSRRSNKVFIAINCSAIPDQLLESELFGYEEGSFTGGKSNGKSGIFEVANGGTIFLDEIGEMAPHIQVKLLRVLQEGAIRKIGGHKEIPIDVRILSATNQNIEQMVNKGNFRLDLLYRINVFNIHIPPLRERKEDCKLLIDHYKKVYQDNYGKENLEVSHKAIDKLLEYSWPGNIRELQNVIERAVALTNNNLIEAENVFLNYNIEHKNCKTIPMLKESLEKLEEDIVIKALKEHKSIRKAAKSIGVTHTLLYNRMKKYGIKN